MTKFLGTFNGLLWTPGPDPYLPSQIVMYVFCPHPQSFLFPILIKKKPETYVLKMYQLFCLGLVLPLHSLHTSYIHMYFLQKDDITVMWDILHKVHRCVQKLRGICYMHVKFIHDKVLIFFCVMKPITVLQCILDDHCFERVMKIHPEKCLSILKGNLL